MKVKRHQKLYQKNLWNKNVYFNKKKNTHSTNMKSRKSQNKNLKLNVEICTFCVLNINMLSSLATV